MKVQCISMGDYIDYYIDYITIGKIYDVIEEDKEEDVYKIIDDDGDEDWYHKEHFKTLSEIRNEKIERLLE